MKTLSLLKTIFLAALIFSGFSLYAAEAIQDEWDDVERLVIVGDIHGDYDGYMDVLREAGLINRRGNWTGDDTHLVQVGDVPDRGPDTKKIIEHLQKLEGQARRDGGMVHVLIGNHEYMNVFGDLRYVDPGEFDALTNRNSRRYQDGYYQQVVQAIEAQNENSETPVVIDDAFKEKWYEDYPLGYVEHRLTWQPGGELNEWVSSHNSIIRINDMLLMHAGLGPSVLDLSISAMNELIRQEILSNTESETLLGDNEEGPLWYRGLASNPETTESPHVQSLLETYGVNHVIVGHTPDLGVITPRFGGIVVVTDTGISAYYGSHKGSMLVEKGIHYALQNGEQIPLPTSDEEMIPYFQTISELQPENARVRAHLENLINPPAEELPVIEETTENL